MRLIHADVVNYKRFRNEVEIDLDPSLVCIVGPNEAGKSSLLNALVQLDSDDAYQQEEKTRGLEDDAMIRVRARFLLNEAELALIRNIPEAREVRQLVMWKRDGYQRGYRLDPDPQRDLGRRADVRGRVEQLRSSPWATLADDEEGTESLRDLVERARVVLASGEQTLDEDGLPTLASLQEEINGRMVPHALRGLPPRLDDLLAYERAPHPREQTLERLRPLIPAFRKFGEAERGLKAVYTLGEDDDPAIRNLLVLAGTSYDEALEVATAADRGRKTVWLDRTRERLLENFTRAWRQSDLEVRFHLDGTVLTVLMSMQAEDFIEIDQRSDGLRQFVALRSYITVAHGSVKPIILIDEAETHLHYDAQADLVQVLEDQEDAAKIIYTTHSAGCLPRDLGTGIRAVVPVTGDRDGEVVQTDDSEIINKFWTQGRGFSPVLIAMGASAFAFSSARRAVIAEGMCETLLLPSLVREAIGGSLDYQVAPGFADATGAEVNDLDLVAARVAYVADGDAGGRDHARKLRRQGVLAEQILYLGGEQSGLSLEDLLVKEVYVDAVNDELSRRHGIRIPATAVPEAGRSAAVARWCRRQTRPDGQAVELSKVDVAQRVLDQRLRRQLLAPQRRILLRQLDEQIRAVLDQATASLGRGEVEQV